MTDAQQLWIDWTALWNGDLALAEKFVTDDFRVHFGNDIPTADDLRGPSELADFIGAFRKNYDTLTYRPDIGPLADSDYVTGRWIADFTKNGTTVARKAGIDILRIADGRVAEAWSVTGARDLLPAAGQESL